MAGVIAHTLDTQAAVIQVGMSMSKWDHSRSLPGQLGGKTAILPSSRFPCCLQVCSKSRRRVD